MRKICVLFLILAVLSAGTVFGQSDFEEMPKNTVGIDIGALMEGLIFSGLFDLATRGTEAEGLIKPYGLGFGLQYERQIIPHVSAAAKVNYLGIGLGLEIEESGLKAAAGYKLHAITVEGHARYYPGDTFFLDGMLGYGLLTMEQFGEVIDTDTHTKERVDESLSRHYFLAGAKIGWRVVFGDSSNGGFTFEPSFGYYWNIALSDSFGKQLAKKQGIETDQDEGFNVLEDYIFIGGPKIAFVFGWTF